MQAQQGPSDRQIAVILSLAIGAVIAVVTTATFWWIYELASGPERRAAAIAAAAPYNLSDEVARIVNAAPNTPTDGRQPWLGADAWQAGVQAGQNYVNQFPQPQGVQVLTGMTTAQIWVYMQQYVSGALGVGCQYCHDINNFASYTYPQKTAGLLMLQLVRDMNSQFIVNLPGWQNNYVQCATCHTGQAVGMPSWGPEFENARQPIQVNVAVVDPATGETINDPALKPDFLQGLVPLKDAILYKLYNYAVWEPYDPAQYQSGRGTLALAYNTDTARGPSQDQVNITQGAMNYMGWSLGVTCTYCHNSRNFYAYEETPGNLIVQPDYAVKRLKTQRMLLMSTWMAENWTKYAIFPKDIPVAEGAGPILVDQQYLTPIGGAYYAMPGCYTCHQANAIPRAAINQANLPEGDAGVSIFPPVLRGTQTQTTQ